MRELPQSRLDVHLQELVYMGISFILRAEVSNISKRGLTPGPIQSLENEPQNAWGPGMPVAKAPLGFGVY